MIYKHFLIIPSYPLWFASGLTAWSGLAVMKTQQIKQAWKKRERDSLQDIWDLLVVLQPLSPTEQLLKDVGALYAVHFNSKLNSVRTGKKRQTDIFCGVENTHSSISYLPLYFLLAICCTKQGVRSLPSNEPRIVKDLIINKDPRRNLSVRWSFEKGETQHWHGRSPILLCRSLREDPWDNNNDMPDPVCTLFTSKWMPPIEREAMPT